MTQTNFDKVLVIIAGVNGAGKSTAYEQDPQLVNCLPIINPDVYAKQLANELGANSISDLPHEEQARVNLKAGKLALKVREDFFKQGKDFGIETTATSEATLRLIDKAHSLNYKVALIYVMLTSAVTHLNRVAQRVKVGGHIIDSDDIKRRFERSFKMFPLLLNKADVAVVYDNTKMYQTALTKKDHSYKLFPCNCKIEKRVRDAVEMITSNSQAQS